MRRVMIFGFLILFLISVVLVIVKLNLAPAAENSETIPFTSDLNILPPDPNLSKEIAAFSGVWEGKWGGRLASRLAVEKIDGKIAIVVYGWADHPDSRFLGGVGARKSKSWERRNDKMGGLG